MYKLIIYVTTSMSFDICGKQFYSHITNKLNLKNYLLFRKNDGSNAFFKRLK